MAPDARPDQPDEPEPTLDRLRGRDEETFAWLVARTQRIVLGLGQSVGLAGADLDDAAAETFWAVYRALPSFAGRSALTTWVYSIACRTLVRFRARRDRHRHRAAPLDAAAHSDAGADAASDGLERREQSEAVWSAVAALGPRSAMAVELFYRRGLSVEEVAAALGCPQGTVKTLLFRARAALRQSLGHLEASR